MDEKKSPLIVLTGPTAVGKTRLSIDLARAVGGEIVSADSMQVYRHMNIGSAKITREQMQGIPHHMIDILDPRESFNVAMFQEKSRECLAQIYGRGHIPVVTGGTGFYIQALLKNVDFSGEEGLDREKEEPGAYRKYLEALAEERGPDYLHSLLCQADPVSAKAIHANNIKRTIRALEFYHLTGQRISEHNRQEKQKTSVYNSCYFVLNDERERLYSRIEQRVEEMLAEGLVEEVKALKRMGCHKGMVSMQGLGYKEILAWLEGECTYEQAVEVLKRDTRHFAKRQLTWFRREREVIWVEKNMFDYDDEKILEFMLEKLWERGIVS